LFPSKHLYSEGLLVNSLKKMITTYKRPSQNELHQLTDLYSWRVMKGDYDAWFDKVCGDIRSTA